MAVNNKDSYLKIIIITVVITIAVILIITNYGTIIKTFYPPNPVIVSHNASDLSSRLFEYSTKVEAVIRNDGGDGDIVFEATVNQNGNSWTKSTKKYFESKKTATIKLEFDEVGLFKDKIQYLTRAYSFGK